MVGCGFVMGYGYVWQDRLSDYSHKRGPMIWYCSVSAHVENALIQHRYFKMREWGWVCLPVLAHDLC